MTVTSEAPQHTLHAYNKHACISLLVNNPLHPPLTLCLFSDLFFFSLSLRVAACNDPSVSFVWEALFLQANMFCVYKHKCELIL